MRLAWAMPGLRQIRSSHDRNGVFRSCIVIACDRVLWCLCHTSLPRIIAVSIVVVAGVGCTWEYIARGVRTVLLHISRRRGLVYRDVTMEVATTDSELGTGVTESCVPFRRMETELIDAPNSLTHQQQQQQQQQQQRQQQPLS